MVFAIAANAAGYGLGIMSIPWFPHNLLWAQLLFALAAILIVIAAAHSAIKSDTGSPAKSVCALLSYHPPSLLLSVFLW